MIISVFHINAEKLIGVPTTDLVYCIFLNDLYRNVSGEIGLVIIG